MKIMEGRFYTKKNIKLFLLHVSTASGRAQCYGSGVGRTQGCGSSVGSAEGCGSGVGSAQGYESCVGRAQGYIIYHSNSSAVAYSGYTTTKPLMALITPT